MKLINLKISVFQQSSIIIMLTKPFKPLALAFLV